MTGTNMEGDIVTTPREVNRSLVPVVQGTLDDILQDETLNAQFGGKDGKLSPSQAGLAAAVTVIFMGESHRRHCHCARGDIVLLHEDPLRNTVNESGRWTARRDRTVPRLLPTTSAPIGPPRRRRRTRPTDRSAGPEQLSFR